MKRIALLPGSFDPPHSGHISTLRKMLETYGYDHVIVAVVHNPTKKRLLTVENSIALLKQMLPTDIADKISIDESNQPSPKLAHQFNAVAIIRGKKKTDHVIKNNLHEIGVKIYFMLHSLLHFHRPIPVISIPVDAEFSKGMRLSSSAARQVLFSAPCIQEDLESLMPAKGAKILVDAKDLYGCKPANDNKKNKSREFNYALSEVLERGTIAIIEASDAEKSGHPVFPKRSTNQLNL